MESFDYYKKPGHDLLYKVSTATFRKMLPQCRPTIKYYRRNNINTKRRFSIHATPMNLLDTTRLLHVFLTRRLVFVDEVRDRILAEPVGDL